MALTRFESIDSLTRFLAVAGVLAALGFLVPVQDVLAQEEKTRGDGPAPPRPSRVPAAGGARLFWILSFSPRRPD